MNATSDPPRASIVVIDDDPGVCQLIRAVLGPLGHSVRTAVDGKRGLDLLAKAPADLLITDIVMPDGDGLEVIMALRNRSPQPRIIAISGGAGARDPDEYLAIAKKLGASRVLKKPFTIKELINAVNRALLERAPGI